jgi:hypothetical protein
VTGPRQLPLRVLGPELLIGGPGHRGHSVPTRGDNENQFQ